MLYACVVYILTQSIGFRMDLGLVSYILGMLLSMGLLGIFWIQGVKQKASLSSDSLLINDQLPIIPRKVKLFSQTK